MWDMPASEDRASEARMGVITAANFGMEMGEHNHGLCNRIAEQKGNDAIWVVVDRLTNSTLFLPKKMTNLVDK
jgi:hypothetical protein